MAGVVVGVARCGGRGGGGGWEYINLNLTTHITHFLCGASWSCVGVVVWIYEAAGYIEVEEKKTPPEVRLANYSHLGSSSSADPTTQRLRR